MRAGNVTVCGLYSGVEERACELRARMSVVLSVSLLGGVLWG